MNYLAFYWTLPVNWAGFTSLPKNADEAAKTSKTIRYQAARVRRWVKDENGQLLREAVFMDSRPDRGTEAIHDEISKVLVEANQKQAGLVLVDFSQAFGWRPHGPLFDMIRDAQNCVLLPPDPGLIDGHWLDPVAHFRAWRDEDRKHAEAKSQLVERTMSIASRLRAEGASYASVAERLNDMGLRTVNGREWTSDNLRKFMASG